MLKNENRKILALCILIWLLVLGEGSYLVYKEVSSNNTNSELKIPQVIELPIKEAGETKEPVAEVKLPSEWELCMEITKGKYIEEIADAVLIQHQKTGLPIWFIYAVQRSESEETLTGVSNAKADNGIGRGCLQVTKVCLKEYNAWHEVKYTYDEMYDIYKNFEVGCWYLARIQNHYLKDWQDISGRCLLYSDIYCAYNNGPSALKKYYQDFYNGYDPVHHQEYNALKRYTNYENECWYHFKSLSRY